MLRDGILQRLTKYLKLKDGVPSRPTEYHLQLRKYSHGRQSTSAICASIITAIRVRDATGCNTLTADTIPYTIRWNTITAVRVPSTTDEAL